MAALLQERVDATANVFASDSKTNSRAPSQHTLLASCGVFRKCNSISHKPDEAPRPEWTRRCNQIREISVQQLVDNPAGSSTRSCLPDFLRQNHAFDDRERRDPAWQRRRTATDGCRGARWTCWRRKKAGFS